MNVPLILLFIASGLFIVGLPEPLLASTTSGSGSVSVFAFVPQRTTSTFFNFTAGGSATLFNSNNTTAFFNIPTDFYSESLRFQTNSYAHDVFTTSKPPPSGKNFIGKAYDFNFYTAAGSPVSAVSRPIMITLNYTDGEVSGMDESALAPYHWGAGDSAWQLIPGGTIDTANNKVTFSTTLFSSFGLFTAPTPAPSPSPAPSGGGGGGGGVSIIAPIPSIIVSGRAYPLSKVVVLKDGQMAISTIAGPDARFEASLTGLAAGNYNFAVYGEDSKGVRSNSFTFPSYITSGATAKVSGIFLAPTISVNKSEVKRGDNIVIFGQSAPLAEVTIAVNSEEDFFVKTAADKDGVYLRNFDTAVLTPGQHLAKSKAAVGGEISSFGKAVGFVVGTKNVAAKPPTQAPAKGDLNNDKQVNLVDFSVVAYWYKRPAPPASADLNGDKKVDLVDFSILAYHWTG